MTRTRSKSVPERSPTDHTSPPRRFAAAVIVLTLIGAWLRFSGLSTRDFWFDESCTFIYVRNLFDWPFDSSLLVESTNLPYYFLLWAWTSAFGHSEAAYRSMSALAATLVIPLLALFVARIVTSPVASDQDSEATSHQRAIGRRAGIVCAALVALNPLHIYYAHEARAYALWTLVLAAMLWLLFEAARGTRKAWWLLYGIALFGCLHLHYFTLWWIPASAVCLVLARDRRRTLRLWLVTNSVIGIAFLPYLAAAVLPAGRGGGSAWLAPGWDPIAAIPSTLWAFLPAGGYAQHLRGLSLLSSDTITTQPTILVSAARVVPAVAVLLAVFLLARHPTRRDGERPASQRLGPWARMHLLFGGMTLLPLVLAWAYSVCVRPCYLAGRYDLVAWPAAMAWLSMIIAQVAAGRATRAATVYSIFAVVVLCSLVPIQRMAALTPPPTFHHVRALELADLSSPGDLVIVFSYDREYLSYYLHRAGFEAKIVSYPSWLDGQIGWVDTAADIAPERADALREDAARWAADIEAVLDADHRVWLLVDSTSRRGPGPRTPVNAHLFEALHAKGLVTEMVDSDVGLLSVKSPS